MLEELLTCEVDGIFGKFTNKYCPVSGEDITNKASTSSGHWAMSKYNSQSVTSRALTEHWDKFDKDQPGGQLGKAGYRGILDMSLGIVYQYSLYVGQHATRHEVVIYDPKIARVKQNKEK